MKTTRWPALLAAVSALTFAAELPTRGDRGPDVASQEDSDPVALELYSSPVGVDLAEPRYPRSALAKNQEAWVRLDFMVDPHGKAYEIAVTDSIGHAAFQQAAVNALEKSTFEPAKFAGEPLDAGHSMYYHFEIEGSPGARPAFARTYRSLMRAIEADNRELAHDHLDQLESKEALNLYEDAFLHVAKSGYYAKWGDKEQQLEALNRAVGHDTAEERLPETLYVDLQRARFVLLVETLDLERALRAFETLAEYELEESILRALHAVADKVQALRDDDTVYSVRGDFGELFSWSYNLYKDEFFLEDVEGEIEEIKLRCARKYVFLRFDPEVQYKIKEDYRPCHLQLIGDPGTTFTLTQL